MNIRLPLLLAATLAAPVALAQPAITSAGNAASYDNTIAPGSIFVLFGRNLGPATLQQASSLPLATSLAGTNIRFTPAAGGSAIDAFMIYSSAGQVSGILPSSAAPGNYSVTVAFNGQASAGFSVRVIERSFGMFTLASSGTGPAVLQNAVSATELVVNQFTAPARPGQVMILYGTGLGAISVPDNAAPGVQDLLAAAQVRVIVGGREITPLYAGRSPGLPGADQINFALPADVGLGCTVPLQVRVAGLTTSRPVSIAIAPSGVGICTQPGLPEDAIRRIAAGQPLTIAAFELSAFQIAASVPILGDMTIRSETFGGGITRITLANAADFSIQGSALALANGACMVRRIRTSGLSLDEVDTPAESLDAGNPLTLNGPNVANRSVPRGTGNSYSLDLIPIGIPTPGAPPPQPVIARGEYTLTAPGGAGVRAFTARLQVPERPNWTNRNDIAAIRRNQPLTVNWTGAGSDDIVLIIGGGGNAAGSTQQDPVYDASLFVCSARASAGTFTVPADITAQLSPVQPDLLTGAAIGLLALVWVPPAETGRFDATLADGTRVDLAAFRYDYGSSKLLAVQ
jgi:uncharacterized protein (TIGR03437 family)